MVPGWFPRFFMVPDEFCHGSRSVFHGYRLVFHGSKSVLHGFSWFQVNSYGFYSSELDFYVSM